MTGTSALTLLVSTIALTVVACGGAGSVDARAPSRDDSGASKELPHEPRTVEEAEEQIARARASLEGGDVKATGTAPKPAEAPASAEKAPHGGAAAREEKPEDVCGSPCRALASMRRAVEALCRMTGDTDNRCVDAKRTLHESSTRISSCKCEGR
jgi:hypothetical protein